MKIIIRTGELINGRTVRKEINTLADFKKHADRHLITEVLAVFIDEKEKLECQKQKQI